MWNNTSDYIWLLGVDIVPSISLDDGKQITFDDLGEGTPVIFIHPPGMGRHVFYYQRKLRKNMRVIFPDLTGHGDSSRANVNEVSIKYYSEELISFLDKLKLKSAVFCGYSAGGAIAQYISSHYRDRVDGLILFGGYPAVLNTLLKWEHKMGMFMVKHHKSILANILAISHTKNENYKKLLITHMNKSQQDAWYKYYQEVLQMNLIKDIKNINVPMLLMYGTKSDLINQYGSFFKKTTNQLRIVFFKHTNHQVPTKKWRLANEEIDQYISKLKKDNNLHYSNGPLINC
jgi:pimeloyl-ACP methyl ester carboxylesterase